MSAPFVAELEERFLRYVKIDTTADPSSSTIAQLAESNSTCSTCWRMSCGRSARRT